MIGTPRLHHRTCIFTISVVVSFVGYSNSHAAILINEVTLNSENSGGSGSDTGKEFIELASDSGAESLSGLTFLVIDGDGSAQGTIDQALSLDGFSTGTNGLFLWRDATDVLLPAPAAATTVNVADFVPDIENGSGTFVLVRGFTGAVEDDLDADDDGTLEAFPWSSVVDAVAVKDSGSSDAAYAGQLGGVDFPNISFAADSIVRLSNTGAWIGVDTDETISEFPGPYTFDDTQAVFTDGTPITPSTGLTFNTLTPGNTNPALIPEPSSLALLGLAAGLLMTFVRRR